MDPNRLIAAAQNALTRGDAAQARRLLAELDESQMPWLLLAKACNSTGDIAGETTALERQLEMEPGNLPALLLTGELKARLGDDRAASSFFQSALGHASVMPDVPAPLHPMLNRARQFVVQSNKRFESHLLDQLGKSGLGSNGRVGTAIDLLLGKKQLYLQEPSSFYFPGLPQRQFYEREEFDWLSEIEAAVPDMRDELLSVIADGREFEPYLQTSSERPRLANPLTDDPHWGAYYFWQNGKPVAENAARCPATISALQHAPLPVIDQRSPMALWSLLKPGTHIEPHNGMLNTRLICHIPLIVPGNCALRVGNEVREWREGEALIFDDSFEHEAWNRSDHTRVILLFEIWRPEISAEERTALTAIFETINDYQGLPQEGG